MYERAIDRPPRQWVVHGKSRVGASPHLRHVIEDFILTFVLIKVKYKLRYAESRDWSDKSNIVQIRAAVLKQERVHLKITQHTHCVTGVIYHVLCVVLHTCSTWCTHSLAQKGQVW